MSFEKGLKESSFKKETTETPPTKESELYKYLYQALKNAITFFCQVDAKKTLSTKEVLELYKYLYQALKSVRIFLSNAGKENSSAQTNENLLQTLLTIGLKTFEFENNHNKIRIVGEKDRIVDEIKEIGKKLPRGLQPYYSYLLCLRKKLIKINASSNQEKWSVLIGNLKEELLSDLSEIFKQNNQLPQQIENNLHENNLNKEQREEVTRFLAILGLFLLLVHTWNGDVYGAKHNSSALGLLIKAVSTLIKDKEKFSTNSNSLYGLQGKTHQSEGTDPLPGSTTLLQ